MGHIKFSTVTEANATYEALTAAEQVEWDAHVCPGEVEDNGTPCRELTWFLDAPGGQVYGYADNSMDIKLQSV